MDTVSARELLGCLTDGSRVACLDVRSEGEFAQGSFPPFRNVPILENAERHEVGLAYKTRGQEAAVELGHRLVLPHKETRIRKWIDVLTSVPEDKRFLACWRGGLRSKIALDWIRESGASVARVEGGYKALRSELLRALEEMPPLLVVAGPTGVGKSRFLAALPEAVLDLEGAASHRGSSFGGLGFAPQPTQASFENLLGLAAFRHRNAPRLVVEDESHLIGRLHLPRAFFDRLKSASVLILDAALEERVDNICGEYVREPLCRGFPPDKLLEELLLGVSRLSKRLGGLRTREIEDALKDAFRSPLDPRAHAAWIGGLLVDYYDPRYAFSMERLDRNVAFRGDKEACLKWISDSRKR